MADNSREIVLDTLLALEKEPFKVRNPFFPASLTASLHTALSGTESIYSSWYTLIRIRHRISGFIFRTGRLE